MFGQSYVLWKVVKQTKTKKVQMKFNIIFEVTEQNSCSYAWYANCICK